MPPTDPASLLHKPIAIVGMACRLPGADNLEEYWQLLSEGRSAIEELPPERLDRELYYDPQKGVRGKTYSTVGGLVSDRPIDTEVCPISAADQQNVDPCHLIMCEVAAAACVQAGYDVRNMPHKNVGVYIGHSGGSTLGSDLVYGTLAAETATILVETPSFKNMSAAEREALQAALVAKLRQNSPQRNSDGSPELDANAAASLITRVLGLTGPHMVTDAACASSVVSLVMGSLAVQRGQVDMAIVGGASYSKAGSLILFSQAQSCSATGTRPFDDNADGLISSEGYVALAIKTLDRALADGDTIQAVISGLGISADGRGRSLWAPRKEGQAAAMQRAYSEHVRAEDVQYVEAHATSTQIGDATEMEALTNFYGGEFKGRRIPVGSVKSNIGHTLETAGLASVLKTVLAIQHRVMPPTINFETPNQEIPWNDIPFEVLTEARPWQEPAGGKVRRAGVNAFGIGGLNVHAVVDEYAAEGYASLSSVKVSSEKRADCPIAIIGRGLILPGANSVAEFTNVLASPESQVVDAPAERWRDSACLRQGMTAPWQTPTNRGGYIRGYEFDWRKYRIPPKQIANANPLQFMLLDAAHQAFDESGYADKEFDRSRTAVVVGTLFGGEFGHQLVVGLRLEELKRQLGDLLRQRGLAKPEVSQLTDEFVEHFLKIRPALIDETGSFTSSTLASRISKELNFMGGAMAVDAGDCSSFAALDVASNLLRSGACSQILCAGAQRSMDLANYEALALQGRLRGSGKTDDGFVPGEGAVAVLLKRLDDAQRDGDRVLGVIHEIAGASHTIDVSEAVSAASHRLTESLPTKHERSVIAGCGVGSLDTTERRSLTAAYGEEVSLAKPKSIEQIGHTMAAFGMVETVRATLEENDDRLKIVSSHAPDGQAYQLAISGVATEVRKAERVQRTVARDNAPITSRPAIGGRIVRFEGVSPEELNARLQRAIDSSSTVKNLSRFSGDSPFRLAILCDDTNDFRQQLQLALKSWQQPSARVALSKKNVFIGLGTNHRTRKAFVFTGQGSQYPGMFADLAQFSPAAKSVLEEANGYLQEISGKSYEELAGKDSQLLGSDIWATQASLLVADLMTRAWLQELHVEADCICGHSFGEYAALCASGSCSIEQIIRITRHRTLALEANIDQRGALLSLQAEATATAELIRRSGLQVSVTHRNAPQQTVVGGTYQAVAQFSEFAEEAGIVGHLLSVPCAFHTPLMVNAQRDFRQALENETLLPAATPLLSSVSNRYLADPEELRENLIRQMVEPVSYLEMIERLSNDGVEVFIEIGPQQVLTRLNGQILAERQHVCLAVDEPKRTPAEQALRIQAQLECLDGCSMQRQTGRVRVRQPNAEPIEHFDATAKRKQGMRTRARVMPQHSRIAKSAALEEFDATQSRRQRTAASAQTRQLAPQSVAPQSVAPQSVAPQPVAPAPVAASDGLESFLIEFIVEHTGYPAEIIDLDWDLEADLGIDSIKKAQLFGELRELFDFESTLDPQVTSKMTLDQFNTLRSILELLQQSGGKSDWLSGPSPALPAEQTEVASQGEMEVRAADSASTGLESFLIDFVVEQTGYPAEIIELDAQFEADLGIDSIKKAQLFGELREHFNLQVDSSSRLSLADFLTLRDVLNTLGQMLEDRDNSQDAGSDFTSQPATTSHQAAAEQGSAVASSQAVTVVDGLLPAPDSVSPVHVEPSKLNGNTHTQSAYPNSIERYELRSALYTAADRRGGPSNGLPASTQVLQQQFSSAQWLELEELADGADVCVQNVAAYQLANPEVELARLATSNGAERYDIDPSTDHSVTTRRVLRVKRLSQLENVPSVPTFSGAALIVGGGPIGDELEQRLTKLGKPVYRIEETDDPQRAVEQFQEIWQREPTPHLFLVGAKETDARSSFDAASWQRRRQRGVMTPFWLCQSWLQRVIESGLAESASLVATLSLGGEFGLSGDVIAAESGGIAGLLKAIIIENWTNDIRTLPVRLIDTPADEPASSVVDAVLRELAVPSYDSETSWSAGERSVIRAIEEPLPHTPKVSIRPGSNWIFTGGARGITAHVAYELAKRYRLNLHLIGTAPLPEIDPRHRDLDATALKQLKIEVMTTARERGENPIKAWEKQEKALEIDANLHKLAEAGIAAKYYACDVADREALTRVLEEIRSSSGSIDAVVHGAGIGKDSRFDKKQPEKVDQCIRAKVDGALALMALTRDDPLQFFVGFGSISGRFGANGHTDYSLANDMLAKTVDWYHGERPEVGAVTFHWHAWGDVGMATKPETRLALEMIGMQFMPAAEGVQHLIRELEAGAPEPEVLITDERYCRMFFPVESVVDGQSAEPHWQHYPLLDRGESYAVDNRQINPLALNPADDPFLAEHRLDDRPLLPIVAGLEMLYEAAAKQLGANVALQLIDIRATNGLKFHNDQELTVRVTTEPTAEGSVLCELRADFCSRDGRVVEADRLYLSCQARIRGERAEDFRGSLPEIPPGEWHPIEYPEIGSKFYLGPPLRSLRKIRVEGDTAWGKIMAPSAIEMTGAKQSVAGWRVPCAALDACLFATGLLAWYCVEPGTALPFSIGELTLQRLPRVGEACLVETKFLRREGHHAWFDFTLRGINGDTILTVKDYCIVWLPSGA